MQSNLMFGLGPMEILIILLLGGGSGLPLGIPPLPPDETLLRATPEECLVFLSSAGIGKPESSSENQTDQLLADEQVQTFLSEFATEIRSAAKQFGEKDEKVKAALDEGQPLVEVLLSRPVAVYLERIEPAADGPPAPVGGMIVNCGDRKADVKNAIDGLEGKALHKNEGGDDDIKDVTIAGVALRQAIAPGGLEVDWGFKDNYFIIAVGPGAAGDLLKRIGGKASQPKWLAALQKQASIKRIGTIAYLNTARLLELALTLVPDEGARAGIATSGLADLTSYVSVAGLGSKGIVNRSFANFKGAPSGLFALLDGAPLTAGDLKPIPAKAVVAGALRLDLTRVYKLALEVAQKVDPDEATRIQQQAVSLAKGMGFRLEEDILASFGDVWTFHSTGGIGNTIGPDPLGGAVLTVTVKNKEMMGKLQNLIVSIAKVQGAQLPFSISETKVGDITGYHVVAQTGGFSPAWALTKDRLVLSSSLDGLKMQLRRVADSQGLAEVPAVASRLKTGAVMLTYQDSKSLLTQVLAMLQGFGPLGVGMLAQQGIKVELPTIPDMQQIAAHVLPRTSTLRIAKQSLVSEAYDTVPLIGSLISSAPTLGLFGGLALSAANLQARGSAGTMQSMNNMKQIALAMLNYESAKKRFPAAAIYSKDGKPLLSWRVQLLPFIGGQEAYDLYGQFHLDEPWDSEHNKPLLAKMPAVFREPRFGDLGDKSVFVVPTGPATIFSDDKGLALKDVTDGTSNTILLVEVDLAHAVPWTKPDDLVVDKSAPATGLATVAEGNFLVGFADGAVIRLPASIDGPTLWALFTRAGGEMVKRPQN